MKYHCSGKLSASSGKLDKKKKNVDTQNTNPKGVTDVANVDYVPSHTPKRPGHHLRAQLVCRGVAPGCIARCGVEPAWAVAGRVLSEVQTSHAGSNLLCLVGQAIHCTQHTDKEFSSK